MANLTFDFLHNYVTGERRASDPADAYQYDEGHVLEAVVPVAVTSCEIQYWIRGMEKADAYTPTSITQNTDNTYTILGNIPNSYFETNGDLRVYIVVTDGDASITTYEGYIHIKERQMPEDYVDDDPDNEAVRVIAAARGYAETSEAWAVGQINGEDVPSTADQYQNNASYYAGQAASAASSAAAQASLAPAYDNTATYAVGDYCLHDGQLYECTTAIATAEAWTAAHWTAVTVGGELSTLKDDLDAVKAVTIDTERISEDISSDITWTMGYMSASGAISTATTLHYSNKIEVSEGDKLIYGDSEYFRFFTAFSGNTAVEASGDNNGNTHEYTVPSGIDGIVVTTKLTEEGTAIYFVHDSYVNVLDPDSLNHAVAEITLPKYLSDSGDLSDNTFIALTGYKQNLRKGERYVFSGNITSLTKIRLGFTYANTFGLSDTLFNEFTIDATNVSYKTNGGSSTYTNQFAHGLTLTNNIQFIFEYLPTGQARISLISNGEIFTQTFTFTKYTVSQPVVVCDTGTLTDCKFSWTPIDIDKKIWLFGDSYIAYSSNRWPYYLESFGYADNVLLDGFPGEGSVNAKNSLNSLINFGVPKYVVWCMGMNDGSDTDASTPQSDWVSNRDIMLSVCEAHNITPIFATIPNVPSILHTGKNAWIKASGYRYIDFAAAVGAESAGATWFSGMLSSDNVHPTEQGARALFARALVDLPELMLGK